MATLAVPASAPHVASLRSSHVRRQEGGRRTASSNCSLVSLQDTRGISSSTLRWLQGREGKQLQDKLQIKRNSAIKYLQNQQPSRAWSPQWCETCSSRLKQRAPLGWLRTSAAVPSSIHAFYSTRRYLSKRPYSVRRLHKFGVTRGQLARHLNALLKDSEHLAAMIDNMPSVDNHDFIMESNALGHTVMDQQQGHGSLLAVAETVTLEDVNKGGAAMLEYKATYEEPTAPVPAAIVACVPKTIHVEEVGNLNSDITPDAIGNAFTETVRVLQNGQGSFARGRSLKKRPKGNLWNRLQNTGVGKHLSRDIQLVSGWAQRTAENTGITDIAAKDVAYVNKMSDWVKEVVGPSFKDAIRDIVTLKVLETEDAVPTPPAPWPQPYYPGLRGFEVMAADVDTLGKYVERVKSVIRNYRVPLQNNYDPDQIAAYFDCRPHVLVFRLLEVFAAFGSVALQTRVQRAALLWKNGGNISEEENTQLTMHTAEALKQTLLGLGTTFIKVAQSLSARPDIIGTETAKVLAELQDRLPPFPSDEAVTIIEEEFGCSLRDIFAYLSPEPVAAASFGQVYHGCTIDGLEVAVKVQRPDLLFSVARDVYILRIGLILLKRVANLSNNYALVADELGHALYGELDYRHEASNAAEFATAHKHVPWMYVPKTLPHLTGRKVLVMEWLSGDRPFDLQCVAQGMQLPDGTVPTWEQQQEAKHRLLNMVNKGTEAALIQLLETGVMHADPHPGNILLSPDGSLQFIDFGLICHMEKKHQGAMLALIAHLVNGEWHSLTDDLADMDVLKPTTDRFAVRLALERSFGEGPDAVIKNGVPDFSFRQITKRFFKVAFKFRFRLPPYYTLVLRSLASLEGFGLAVNPDFKTFGAAYPYVVRQLLLNYSPTTQWVLRSLLLDEKRQLKWDRISSLVAISRKSAADRAALDMVIIPKGGVHQVSSSGETQMPESSLGALNLVGLVLAKEGVGIRRVLLEADTRALALVFVSRRAAMWRRKVAHAIGGGLFVMLREKFSFEGIQSSPITGDASKDLSSSNFLPLSQSSTAQKRRRLEFLLKAMLGRLRGQMLLFTQVGWSSITIICWALAIACHKYAVYISNVFLGTDHKTGAGIAQGHIDEHKRIRSKQGVVPILL